jgi:hypothetical protein
MSEHRFDIETVAEVERVEREAVSICFHDDQRIVHLMQSTPWRDLQSISWPVAKTPEIIRVLQLIYDAEQAG